MGKFSSRPKRFSASFRELQFASAVSAFLYASLLLALHLGLQGAWLTCPRGTCPGKSFFPGHACPRIHLWGGDAGFSGFLFPFFNAASLPCESCGACVFTSRRVARYTAICHHHAELVSRRLIARQASQMRLSHVALLAVYGVPSCFSSQLVVVLSRHTPEALETTLIGPGTANDR